MTPTVESAVPVFVQPGFRPRTLIIRYAASIIALAIPMAVTVALKGHPNLNPIISASFVIVISAVAWWAGIWAGILVSCLTIPALTLAATNGKIWLPAHIDFIGLPIFWFICFLIDRVASNRKQIEQVLRDANSRLEVKVQERTAELAQREREFRTVVNAIPQICWVSRPDGSVIWYNDRWYEYTGISKDRPEAWEPYILEDVLGSLLQRWQDSIEARQGFEMEVPIRGANGEFRWFLTRTVAIHDKTGNIRQWFGTSTDIDDLKRSREALIAREKELRHANSDLQQFAYSASHDLQEPIRTVAVYSQMIERRYASKLDDDAKKFLGFVGESAKRMEKLVRDLLEYVQTAHVDRPISEMTPSADALRDVVANLAAALEETQGEITNGPLPAVRIRRTHLEQIFQNLLSNSLKYRGAQRPKIHVAANRQEHEWVFSVQDNGIGIDPAYKERIFGIFKRLHTADKYSGTGIGLAICQRIVERYGGQIWVESELGRGSTFFFTIPE